MILLGMMFCIQKKHDLAPYWVHGSFPKLGVPTIVENQMEKKLENEMETGIT